jgi:CRP-like cAMP-binding protein
VFAATAPDKQQFSMNHLAHKLSAFVGDLSRQETDILDNLTSRRLRTVNAHRDVIRQGDRIEFAHILCKGWAVRTKHLSGGEVQIVGLLLPGDWCGFDPSLGSIADHSIETITECEIALVTASEIIELMSSNKLRLAVSRSQMATQAIQMDWTVNVGRRDAQQALAHFVCELHFRLTRCGVIDSLEFELPLNQVTLSDCLAISAVHTNRVLRDLRERSLMELHSRWLRILDLDRLQHFADFNPSYMHGQHPSDE